ncbi:uncharacterized protein EV422DRAFT_409026 [Fimicolochytrium jonesii]|uniref:uncharacterized protein n=1 Tax=Fimicolochytrium jonesii TaxID=1396493 RepID=UPI0022FDBAE0|nr:uncharacterized protein EV422DRAFT_409026 [Fimicolochytrium jonesii]KAI8822665.1 hypothetical protein EV422DRAFT_409026 [Fimicolochytrium jonesii]
MAGPHSPTRRVLSANPRRHAATTPSKEPPSRKPEPPNLPPSNTGQNPNTTKASKETSSTPLPTQLATVFPALLAEADRLTKQSHYTAATSLYTRALELLPTHAHALSSRARCLILAGDNDGALSDANLALKSDPDNARALASKADALFARGDFEDALVWYHRGGGCRPDVEEFRQGVVRATQAITAAVGGIDAERLKAQRRMALVSAAAAEEAAAGAGKKKKRAVHHPGAVGKNLSARNVFDAPSPPTTLTRTPSTTLAATRIRPSTASRPSSAHHRTRPTSASTLPRETIERNLLEELYDDHAFLASLAADPLLMTAADGALAAIVDDGRHYMEGRLEYWRARNPSGRPASAIRRPGSGVRRPASAGNKGRPASARSGARPGAATPVRRMKEWIC